VTTALLVIAHGSRQEDANADLHHVVTELRRHGTFPIVEPAFLELTEPTILQAGRRCVERAAQRVILLPYFLSAGVHATSDLEAICRQLSADYPHVQFLLAKPLGRHPLLLDVLMLRAREALDEWDQAGAS
jgi:sirohydrochlorin ferrochelatase